VVVGPASVAQVANLQLQVFTQLWATALRSILLNLMLDLPRIDQVKLEVGDVEDLAEVIVALLRFILIHDTIELFSRF
jgi:hypothetical protein